MTDLRKAAEMALNALEFNCPVVEDYGSKEQLKTYNESTMALYKALAQPEQSKYSDIVSDGGLDPRNNFDAQPEQEEPLAWATFDGEGNYDFRSYEDNETYRDEYIKRNGLKYANWVKPLYTAPPKPEPKSISTNDHLCAMLRQVHDVLACTALPIKRKWVGLTGVEINHIFAANVGYPERMCLAIEAKLKEKNNAV